MRAILLCALLALTCHDRCRDEGFTSGLRLKRACRCYVDFKDEDLLYTIKVKAKFNGGQPRAPEEL